MIGKDKSKSVDRRQETILHTTASFAGLVDFENSKWLNYCFTSYYAFGIVSLISERLYNTLFFYCRHTLIGGVYNDEVF